MKLLIDDFENELTTLAREASGIKVMIAFLTQGGLGWMPDELIPNSEFVVGIDLGITTPEALKHLQDKGSCLRVFQDSGRMFHPKAIYLDCGADEFLIIGSNNLTCAGISSNHEIAVLIRKDESTESTFDQFQKHFEDLKNHPAVSSLIRIFMIDTNHHQSDPTCSFKSTIQFLPQWRSTLNERQILGCS